MKQTPIFVEQFTRLLLLLLKGLMLFFFLINLNNCRCVNYICIKSNNYVSGLQAMYEDILMVYRKCTLVWLLYIKL